MASVGEGVRALACPTWDDLCAQVADWVRRPLDDPFALDMVVVPSRGHQRFLAQAVSTAASDGICAGVDFASWDGLRRRCEAGLLGVDGATDPWHTRPAAFAVLDLLDDAMAQPWGAVLAHHIDGHGPRPGRRAAVATDIAELFLGYARRCPDMLLAWDDGADVDAAGAPLVPTQAWQPALWRALVAALAAVPHPARRRQQLLAALAKGSGPSAGPDGLPPRLAAVVTARLPASDAALLDAVAARIPTLVCTYSPLLPACRPAGFAARYGGLSAVSAGPARDDGPERRDTLLHALQADLRHQRSPDATMPADGSVQVHASHGPDRQVEVLREVLCGLLEDDPTLEPRDIVVLCTDLPTYAPLVTAALCQGDGLTDSHPGQRLRVQVGPHRRPQPVLACVADVLALPRHRATRRDLLDLCAKPWVAARFDLTADDLARLPGLLATAGVAWGLDQAHRGDFGLANVREGTWLDGVQRLATAVAVGDRPGVTLGPVVPAAAVDPGEVDLIGRVAEVVSRVRRCRHETVSPATVAGWVERLRTAMALLLAPAADDAWLFDEAHQILDDLATAATGRTAQIELADLLHLLPAWWEAPSARPAYGNGSLLVTRLGDLDGVPHRVVCVLGLDDARFPPRLRRLDADLGAAVPDPEDPRARARHNLFQAVLAAGDHFIVIAQGASPRTNEPLPPSVPVIDLLTACGLADAAHSWTSGDDPDEIGLVRRHSLQPYSWTNFVARGETPPFSFDEGARLGAIRLGEPPTAEQAPLWSLNLGTDPPTSAHVAEDVSERTELDALVSFMKNPADELLRRQVGWRVPRWRPADRTLVGGPDSLATWRLGDAFLRGLLDGADPGSLKQWALRSPDVPPGRAGVGVVERVADEAAAIALAVQRFPYAPRPHDVRIRAGRHEILGQVDAEAGRFVLHRYGWIGAPHLAEAWLRLLALAATAEPGRRGLAVLLGKGPARGLVAPSAATARETLARVADLRAAGLRHLVPLPVQTAYSWARAHDALHDGADAARAAWEGGWGAGPAEAADPAWCIFFPGGTLEELLTPGPESSDPGSPAPLTGTPERLRTSRFAQLAEWFWRPLLGALLTGPEVGRAWVGEA